MIPGQKIMKVLHYTFKMERSQLQRNKNNDNHNKYFKKMFSIYCSVNWEIESQDSSCYAKPIDYGRLWLVKNQKTIFCLTCYFIFHRIFVKFTL